MSKITQADRDITLLTQQELALNKRAHYLVLDEAFARHREQSQAELLEALEHIEQRCKAYPKKVFGEPDLDAVNAALEAAGIPEQMDRLHASWARDLLAAISETATTAITKARGES